MFRFSLVGALLFPVMTFAMSDDSVISTMTDQNYDDENWAYEYCNSDFDVCIPLHRNFWYGVFPGVSDALFHIELGTKQIEERGDGPITVRIRAASYTGREGKVINNADGTISVRVVRDGATHFVVEGPEELEVPIVYLSRALREEPESVMVSEPVLSPDEASNHDISDDATEGNQDMNDEKTSTGETSPPAGIFPDVPDSSVLYLPLIRLSKLDITQGNPDGRFHPERDLNRAEFLTLLYRAKEIYPRQPRRGCYKDVLAGEWYTPVICHATRVEYVGGYPDSLFRPEAAVSRVEAFKMIYTVLGLDLNTNSNRLREFDFEDVHIDQWYIPFLASAFNDGIALDPKEDSLLFHPGEHISREEAVLILHNALFR